MKNSIDKSAEIRVKAIILQKTAETIAKMIKSYKKTRVITIYQN